MLRQKGLKHRPVFRSFYRILLFWAYEDNSTATKYNWRFTRDELLRNRVEMRNGYPITSADISASWKVDTDTLKFWKAPNCVPYLGGGEVCDPVDTVKYHILLDEGKMYLTNQDNTLVLEKNLV